MNLERVFAMKFSKIYPMYVQKVEKKGRSVDELNTVLRWLTGYTEAELESQIQSENDLKTFFAEANNYNPNAELIKGVVCGVRVEDVEDPLMQKIRYMDKLVDELARGKKLQSIVRS